MSWLSIVGIGEDGVAGLSEGAKAAISEAELVFGGERHLGLAAPLIRGDQQAWLSPFSLSIEAVVAARGKPVCVLASGDPFHFGVGATLARRIDPAQMRVFPHSSAFSLAAARLGWPLGEVATLSLHGRSLDLVRPYLQPGGRVLALTSDGQAPGQLAALLDQTGFGQSIITVLEALGGPEERIRSQSANAFGLAEIHPLNICAISVVALPGARVLPLAPGRDDALFEHDGQITKREVRALTLAALAPRQGELLWDVGAGSGSIGIEWMLADPSLRAIAVEDDSVRADRIGRNAYNFGVPGLQIVLGRAPEALAGLEPPHAIFIGGGGSDPELMRMAQQSLQTGGRLVANAVTLEMEALLLAQHAIMGGSLTRIEISRAAPLGSMQGWRPAMPVLQWCWSKP